MKTRTDAEIRAALPAAALAVFDSILNALAEGSEEIYGPGEEHYVALMEAVSEAALARIASFAGYQTEQAEDARKQGDDEAAGEYEARAVDARFALERHGYRNPNA